MPIVDTSKLHVSFADGTLPDGPLAPRRYTLTHSDATGELFLTIGAEYDREALNAFQTRLMRDEVLGDWVDGELHLHVAAQGGLPVFGTAQMRCDIFCRYKSMVLSAMRFGDRVLVESHPELDEAPVTIHFHYRRRERDWSDSWGLFGDSR